MSHFQIHIPSVSIDYVPEFRIDRSGHDMRDPFSRLSPTAATTLTRWSSGRGKTLTNSEALKLTGENDIIMQMSFIVKRKKILPS